jgi:hypothetical protein
MRDIIWTVIVIWIVWKLYDAFTSFGKQKSRTAYSQPNTQQNNYQQTNKEGEIRIDNKGDQKSSHFKPDDGEYVDYEEIK